MSAETDGWSCIPSVRQRPRWCSNGPPRPDPERHQRSGNTHEARRSYTLVVEAQKVGVRVVLVSGEITAPRGSFLLNLVGAECRQEKHEQADEENRFHVCIFLRRVYTRTLPVTSRFRRRR